MNNLLLVFIGGGAGSAGRYLISLLISERIRSFFPWGTLTINILSCLLLGFLTAWLTEKNDMNNIRLLVGTGFCGGFSTFSAFTAETFDLFSRGQTFPALIYIGSSLFACLLAFALGFAIK